MDPIITKYTKEQRIITHQGILRGQYLNGEIDLEEAYQEGVTSDDWEDDELDGFHIESFDNDPE